MASNQGNGNSNWYNSFWNFFDIKQFTGFLSSGGSGGSNNNQGDDDDDNGNNNKGDDDDDDGNNNNGDDDDDDNGDHNGDQSPIDSANIGFGVGIRVIENNGDTTFQNTIDECVFHSAKSFDPLCIKCKFLDAYGKVVAKGKVIKLDESYTASDRVPIEMHSVPEALPGDPVANDVKKVKEVKLAICGFDCKCIKPTKFTVKYEGPSGVTVKIFKKIKNGAPDDFVFQVSGTFSSGINITIDSRDWGQNTVNADTVYAFYKYGKLIGFVKIHTSCSQPLFVGDMFFYKQGDPTKQIKLTVISGFDKNNNPAIPPSSCKEEEPPSCECIKPTTFTVKYEGPSGVTVKIFKKIKNGAPDDFVFQVSGTFSSGINITIDSRDWGQNTVNPDTVYAFYKNGYLIGYVKIHTSCSQPLFIDQMFFYKQGDLSKQIKLTVVSGFTSNGSPAIPPSSCEEEEPGFFVGGGKVYVPKNGGGTYTLTHGFELHCDPTLGPNNLEINWPNNKFHLEQLVTANCIDNGGTNEPPPSPHPGPTLDVYTGEGYGRYNGKCGAYATWSMDDKGEPGKDDQILSLKIYDKKGGNLALDIGSNALNLKTGNHQWVPHPSTHPNPPTQTTPCPEMTP